MDRKLTVKTIPIQYGDIQIRCHKIKGSGEEYSIGEPQFHSHKYYECHFIEKGSVCFYMADKNITLSQSEMLIIPPNVGHFSVVPSESFTNHVFEFSIDCTEAKTGDFFKILTQTLKKAALSPVKVSQKLISMTGEFKNMTVNDAVEDYLDNVAKLTNIISMMFNEISAYSASQKTNFAHEDIEVLLDVYINDRKKTLDDIAEATSYSRRHISRIVRNLYGMSLSDLRNEQRIQTAKGMLRATDYSIDRIALDAGFKSANAMRESFKKCENITPSEYRKLFKE